MERNVEDLRDLGYTVIPNASTPEFNSRLREAVTATANSRPDYFTNNKEGRNAILGVNPIFEEALLNPKLLTLGEVAVGKGALLQTLSCSVRREGMAPIGLHTDMGWFPTPFPEHTLSITFCWACDEYTKEGGATAVIPGSHKKRRPPSLEEMAELKGLVPIEAPAGSLTVWRGDTWHTNYPRLIDGGRAVMHVGLVRLALRPLENYDHLDEAWLKDKPYELRVLLGREDFLYNRGGMGQDVMDPDAISRTIEWGLR